MIGAGNGAQTRDLNVGKVVAGGGGYFPYSRRFRLVNSAGNQSRAEASDVTISCEMTQSRRYLHLAGTGSAACSANAAFVRPFVRDRPVGTLARATDSARRRHAGPDGSQKGTRGFQAIDL